MIASPKQINKQVEPITTPIEVFSYQPQFVSEIEPPQLSKQEVVNAVVEAPKPKPTQVAPKQKGCEAYRSEFSKYNWNVDLMMAIAMGESGCNPNAVGDNYPIRGLHAVSCGLLQIRTLAGRPTCTELKDPATNIAWAYRIYQGQGLKAWSVYTKGIYKKYL